MFNRNPNIGRQFDAVSLDAGPAPVGGPPRHRRKSDAIRVPLAGGEFIADGEDRRWPHGGTSEPRTQQEGMSMGHWISQSAQTVLPGGAAWHTDDEGGYAATFATAPEDGVPLWQRRERKEAEGVMIAGGYHGTTTYKNGSVYQGVGGAQDVQVYDQNAGDTIETWETTGARVREILNRQREARKKRLDGGS